MSTLWAYPNKFFQYSESGAEEVDSAWQESDFNEARLNDKKSLGIVKPLYHISRSPKTDLVNHTYFLRVSGFNFINLPGTLSGIELKLNTRRAGRIIDHTVQIFSNNDLVGDNLATLTTDPEKIYGGSDSMWNSNLTINDINSEFGFVLRFKAHPKWPHRDSIFIDAISVRLH
jgi:hypothetical protein